MDSVVSKSGRTPRFAWAVLILLYFAAIAAPLSMFKVGVLAPALIPALDLDPSTVGALMSVFNIAGLVLALPAGVLVARLGAKKSILISLGCTALGSILGAFSSQFAWLAATRVLEGAGLGLVAVCVPSAITEWFPIRRRGVALGVFTTYMPTGNIIGLALYPSLDAVLGWNAAWWFAGAFAVVMFVLVLCVYRRPTAAERLLIDGGVEIQVAKSVPFKESLRVLSNGWIWMAAIVFMLFNICSPGGASQYMTTFFTESLGVSLTVAGVYGVVVLVVIIACEPLVGFLSDRIGSRKVVIVVPLALMFATAWFLYFPMPDWIAIILHALFLSVFAAGVASGTYAAASEMVDRPEDAGMSLGLVSLFQNLGLIIGPVLLGAVYASSGFIAVAHFEFMPILGVAFVLALLTKYKPRNSAKAKKE